MNDEPRRLGGGGGESELLTGTLSEGGFEGPDGELVYRHPWNTSSFPRLTGKFATAVFEIGGYTCVVCLF